MVSLVAVRPRCQGLSVTTGTPCRIAKHLNSDGYCKFHAPAALQCRGIATSTGQRCRIKWDLNGNQFCHFHVQQVASPTFPMDATDNGKAVATLEGEESGLKTKKNAKEDTSKVKVVQTKLTCLGMAKSTGKQCRINWDLNADQLCKHHKHQHVKTEAEDETAAVPVVRRAAPLIRVPKAVAKPTDKATQCRGMAKTTGKQCRIDWDLNAHGFCHHHVRQQPLTARL